MSERIVLVCLVKTDSHGKFYMHKKHVVPFLFPHLVFLNAMKSRYENDTEDRVEEVFTDLKSDVTYALLDEHDFSTEPGESRWPIKDVDFVFQGWTCTEFWPTFTGLGELINPIFVPQEVGVN